MSGTEVGGIAGTGARVLTICAGIGVRKGFFDPGQHLQLFDLFVGKFFARHLSKCSKGSTPREKPELGRARFRSKRPPGFTTAVRWGRTCARSRRCRSASVA